MGVVYAAHDPQLGRTVAIKLLQPMAAGERARERLQREAQAMARLQHPNVVGVFETGIHGDQVFVAMEYVEGGTLGDWLRVRGLLHGGGFKVLQSGLPGWVAVDAGNIRAYACKRI